MAKRLGWHTHVDEPVGSGGSSSSSVSPRGGGGDSLLSSSSAADGGGDASPNSGGGKQKVDWNVYWTDSGLNIDRVVRAAKVYQRINHFPGMVNIYRKTNLARSMSKMMKINSKAYDFFPKTWVLPSEASEVTKYLNHNLALGPERANRCVIVKPSGGAQGKGIYLCMHPQALRATEDAVAQVYIHRPLLINGFKFDLRIYALVTSVDPLRVLLYVFCCIMFSFVLLSFLDCDVSFSLLSIYCCLPAFSNTTWHKSNHHTLPLN